MADQGKEDIPRPMFIDKETFAKNWELTFAKKKNPFDKPKEVIVEDEQPIPCEENGNDGEG